MTSDELLALDKEWEALCHPGVVNEGDYAKPVSSNAAACFGPYGPWEWLVGELQYPILSSEPGDEAWCTFKCETSNPHHGSFEIESGATIFEAISRCAIEARRKLQ